MDANNDSGGGMMPTEQWVTNEIKALEQAHAELAAKVETLTEDASRSMQAIVNLINKDKDLSRRIEHQARSAEMLSATVTDRLDDLQSRVVAYDETCGQIHNSHITRHNENRADIDRIQIETDGAFSHIKVIHDRFQHRIAALEHPAPAPDPVCQSCGGDGLAKYERAEDVTFHRCQTCGGAGTVPTAEPEPAPLDPVLVERAEAMYICWMGEPWPRPALSGADEFNDLPQGSRVRWIRLAEAYGRDGAR